MDREYGKYVLPQEAIPAIRDAEDYLAAYEVNGYTDLEKYSEWYAYVKDLYPELF